MLHIFDLCLFLAPSLLPSVSVYLSIQLLLRGCDVPGGVTKAEDETVNKADSVRPQELLL